MRSVLIRKSEVLRLLRQHRTEWRRYKSKAPRHGNPWQRADGAESALRYLINHVRQMEEQPK